MVTGLQLPLQNFFAEHSAAKSHSDESETVQGLSFGGMLRAKEKQLQDAQTVEAASIAAAVTAWQALPAAQRTGETIPGQVLVDLQSPQAEAGAAMQTDRQTRPVDRPEKTSSTASDASVPPETPPVTLQSQVPTAGEAMVEAHSKQLKSTSEAAQPAPGTAVAEKPDAGSHAPSLAKRAETVDAGRSLSLPADSKSRAVAPASVVAGNIQPSQPVAGAVYQSPRVKTSFQGPAASETGSDGQFHFYTTSTMSSAGFGSGEAESKISSREEKRAPSQTPILVAAGSSTSLHGSPEISLYRQAPNEAQTDRMQDAANKQGYPVRSSGRDAQWILEPAESQVPLGVQLFEGTETLAGNNTKLATETRKFEAGTHSVPGTADEQPAARGVRSAQPGTPASIPAVPAAQDMPEREGRQATAGAEQPVATGKQSIDHVVRPGDGLQPRTARVETEAPGVEALPANSDKARQQTQSIAFTNEPAQAPVHAVKNVTEQADPPVEALQTEKTRLTTHTPASEAFPTDSDENTPRMQPVALTEAPAAAPAPPSREAQPAPVLPDPELAEVKTGAAEVHVKLRPVPVVSQLEVGADLQTVESSSGSRFAQAAQPLQGTILGNGDVAGNSPHVAGTSPKHSDRSVLFEKNVAKIEPVPARLEGKTDTTVPSAPPGPFNRQEALQPVLPSPEPMQETRQIPVVGNATEAADGNGKPAAKRPETGSVDEAAASQAPQARGNTVESVAATGFRTDAKVPAAEVIQQIAHHVQVRVRERATQMRLQLNPKELGAIEIQMVSGPQGVSVTFSAEQPATGRLLETQLNQLHQALTEAGVQLAGLNVGQHGQTRQEGGFLQQNQPFIHFSQPDDPPKGANVQEPRRPLRGSGRPGEVDYLI